MTAPHGLKLWRDSEHRDPMRIRVVHETVYRYDSPARGLIQMLRLTPRDHDGQHVRAWRIEPTVDGRLSRREDGFGNVVHVFSADGPEEAMTIRVTGEVETTETHGVMRGISEWLPDPFYLRESRFAVADEAIRAFADETVGDSADPLDRLHRLLAGVHQAVDYAPGPTGATTTAAEVFSVRKGVAPTSPTSSSRRRATSRSRSATSRAITAGRIRRSRRRATPGSRPGCPISAGSGSIPPTASP